MMPAGLFFRKPHQEASPPAHLQKRGGVIRLEGDCKGDKRGGKAMQPSCTEPNQLDTKGKREEGKKDRRERGRWERRGKKEGEREDFYKKIGFCKFLLGLYKRILGKKVYICNIRIRNR